MLESVVIFTASVKLLKHEIKTKGKISSIKMLCEVTDAKKCDEP